MQSLRAAGRRATRASLSAIMAAGILLVLPDAAHAAPELAPVMLVLDASGSMKEAAAGGVDKMTAAKRAVQTLVRQAPDGAQLGLAVYGTGTGNASSDKAAGCKDVKVAHEPGPLDRSALTTTVNGLRPSGYTPIGQSLRVAAAELPAEGPRSIVLISDGEDTCAPPDPCQVAKELAQQGVDLRIHAVGFAVDGKARRQLSCLARATGGTYVDAPDAGTLASALNRITQRALRFYEPIGTPVAGTPTPDGAPGLQSGAYLDQMGRDEDRYYTVNVPPRYTLYATATAILSDGGQYLLHIGRYDGAGRKDCTPRATQIKNQPVASAHLRWEAPAAGSAGGPCGAAGTTIVRVSLDHAAFGLDDGAHTLELLIGLEPPLTGDPGPAGTTDRAVFTAPSGPAQPVSGGGSFNSAATLPSPGSYTETVLSGEMVFYRIRLGWGQGLAYRVRLGKGDGRSILVKTAWYNPARAEQQLDSAAYRGAEYTMSRATDALGGPPVRYRNRELTGPRPAAGVSVAGWYYVSILVNPSLGEPVEVPVTLDVSVDGAVQSTPGYEAGKEAFGEQSAGPAGGGQDAAQADRGLWSRVADAEPLIWLAGIPLLMLLVGAVLAVVLLTRRRRRPAHTVPRPPHPPWQ